jgi:hypothetical protein
VHRRRRRLRPGLGLPKTLEAFVDFNTKHKCRNFEAIRAWAEPRQIPEKMPRDFLVPPEPEDIFDLIP